ncbi:MAG: AAA family ATPase [Pirellulaceae bacterium]|nr:AAA family ATPase [Pirellulaceae bacterium]
MAGTSATRLGETPAGGTPNGAPHDLSPDIVEFLADPATHGADCGEVERLETHISWLFLTPRHVYKLKKPVRFDFLDFSTCELRRHACQEEVRLNQRLAPRVYLAAEPVARDAQGQLRLGGRGSPVDWVVKMRRLPADRALDRLLREQRLASYELQQLAACLTDFYLGLPPVTVKTDLYRARLQHHVEDNDRELSDPRHGLPAARVQRVHAAQRAFLWLFTQQFDDRVCDGRIVEGHGDLRPEHIYLHGGPTVIDCIEFNLEYRQLDVVDELSFLAMECELLGAENLGRSILEHYCRASGDSPSPALVNFYAGYRACVRAKVAAIRSDQLPPAARAEALERAEQYLRLAERHSRLPGQPLLLVVHGLSGSGKSTLAAALADRFRLHHLQTDAIRRELFATPDRSPPAQSDPRYRPENRQRVYDEMFTRAERLLAQGCGAVLDGTFLTTASRQQALELALRHAATVLLVHCTCPLEVAQQRIAARRQTGAALSDAFPALAARQLAAQQPAPPAAPLCQVNTADSLAELLDNVTSRMRELVSGKLSVVSCQ